MYDTFYALFWFCMVITHGDSLHAFPKCKSENGTYRNHIQCDAYYQCINGDLFPKECGIGYQYKSSDKKCVIAPKGQCHKTGLVFGCPLLWRGLGNKCYAVSEMLSSYQDQVEACKYADNSRMAEIRNAEELKYIGLWLNNSYGDILTDFYLNIKFDQSNKQWVYESDNSKVVSELFSPNDFQSYYSTCVIISRQENYTLRSVECVETFNALCEQDPDF